MKIHIFETAEALGARAGSEAVSVIQRAIEERGEASIICATGMTQFPVLDALIQAQDIAWDKVTGFHLDEYIGLPRDHAASFRMYLKDRFVDRLPRALAGFHYIDGEADPTVECQRLGDLIRAKPVDLCLAGIGDNGHLAFNDPPADFESEDPFLIVGLDETSRNQQLGQGWFETLDDVPTKAISMSIRQIMKSNVIICSVNGERKARTVVQCLEGPVIPGYPASVLQQHPAANIYMDTLAASLLSDDFLNARVEKAPASPR